MSDITRFEGYFCCKILKLITKYWFLWRFFSVPLGRNQPLKPESPKWKSDVPLTDGQLRSKRDEFWETAPAYEGRKEIWDALRGAAQAMEGGDHVLAQAIIDGASISCPNGKRIINVTIWNDKPIDFIHTQPFWNYIAWLWMAVCKCRSYWSEVSDSKRRYWLALVQGVWLCIFSTEIDLTSSISNCNSHYYSGADLEGGAPGVRPSIFCRDRAPDFVWAPQAKRMHQIMQIDFENYNFCLFLRGHIPLRHPLSPQAPKFCQSLIWAPPLLKNHGFARATPQGFFSKFLMGGTQNFRSPSVADGDEVGWGGLAKKIWLKPKLPT